MNTLRIAAISLSLILFANTLTSQTNFILSPAEAKIIAEKLTNYSIMKQEIKLYQRKITIMSNLWKIEEEKKNYYKSQITSIRINTIIWAIIVGTAYYLGTQSNK